jgi:hypothetical protein
MLPFPRARATTRNAALLSVGPIRTSLPFTLTGYLQRRRHGAATARSTVSKRFSLQCGFVDRGTIRLKSNLGIFVLVSVSRYRQTSKAARRCGAILTHSLHFVQDVAVRRCRSTHQGKSVNGQPIAAPHPSAVTD